MHARGDQKQLHYILTIPNQLGHSKYCPPIPMFPPIFIHAKSTFFQCLESSRAFQVLSPLESLWRPNFDSEHWKLAPFLLHLEVPEVKNHEILARGAGAKREVKGLNNTSRLGELLTDLCLLQGKSFEKPRYCHVQAYISPLCRIILFWGNSQIGEDLKDHESVEQWDH
jgi:hypothetical protein